MSLAEKYNCIYDEMLVRNKKNLFLVNDPLLNSPYVDKRRCLALYCDNIQISPEYDDIVRLLNDYYRNSIIYVPNPMDATRDGQLHHTFMQIVGFNEFETNKDKILTSIDKYSNVLDRINLPRYTIKFHRLCPLKSGIAMLGIPSIDINVYRETFRKLVSMEDLPFAEPYKNDIVHSSIIRYFNELQQENIVDEIGHINITAKCTFLTLGFGTWKLLSNECMNYYTKILK